MEKIETKAIYDKRKSEMIGEQVDRIDKRESLAEWVKANGRIDDGYEFMELSEAAKKFEEELEIWKGLDPSDFEEGRIDEAVKEYKAELHEFPDLESRGYTHVLVEEDVGSSMYGCAAHYTATDEVVRVGDSREYVAEAADEIDGTAFVDELGYSDLFLKGQWPYEAHEIVEVLQEELGFDDDDRVTAADIDKACELLKKQGINKKNNQ